jgi:transcriptional regulator of acetoin/glycerol metabolism
MGKNGAVITIPLGTSLNDAEKAVIEATLRSAGGNISVSARILGIDRCTLYNKIEKYKITR